ncbi:unnamed protein product [Merluccius merluccius]
MLKPQQRHSDLILRESLILSPPPPPPPPPVCGKPWYWYRSPGTMESTRSLAQVIMEMQHEIRYSEGERRPRGQEDEESPPGGREEEPPGGQEEPPGGPMRAADAGIENPYAQLRRNASAPALDGQYKEKAVMTVRRYSISSNMPGVTGREGVASGWGRLQEEVSHGGAHARFEMEKHTKKHALQDLVHKNRAKVKTVTFLLPVDDIYTNRPVLTKHQEDPRTTELDSITETDY